jgi:hypothetical protein
LRYTAFIVAVLFTSCITAQSRVKKLSINSHTSFYSYGEGQGHLNNVVRLAEDIGITYKTYDTVKKKGMIYELSTMNTTAYYKNILPGNAVLEVNDLFTNFNFIFPMLLLYQGSVDQIFGVGLGIGTLAGRDYLDDNNNLLPYNTTNFKEVKFGKYWTGSLMLDYELSMKFYKRIGLNLGLRYTAPAPVHSNDLNFTISQGTGLTFKFGMFYQLK